MTTSEKNAVLAVPLSSGPKSIIKRLIGDRNYYRLRADRLVAQHRRSPMPLLFVHQMGKVGSTSVVATLEQQQVFAEHIVYQTHFLTPSGYAFLENLELTGHGGWKRLPEKGKFFLSMSGALTREIEQGYLSDRTVKVISLVRDPVATNLSGFFHNTDWWPQELRDVAISRSSGWQERLWLHFLETYPHSVPATWFDMEMKPLFDIDVMASQFPQERGYQLYSSPVASLLLLKLESLDQCAVDAFREFLGIDYRQPARSNRADDKWYANLYREFIATTPIPESYLSSLYQTDFARHFYSPAEIDGFTRRWRRI